MSITRNFTSGVAIGHLTIAFGGSNSARCCKMRVIFTGIWHTAVPKLNGKKRSGSNIETNSNHSHLRSAIQWSGSQDTSSQSLYELSDDAHSRRLWLRLTASTTLEYNWFFIALRFV